MRIKIYCDFQDLELDLDRQLRPDANTSHEFCLGRVTVVERASK